MANSDIIRDLALHFGEGVFTPLPGRGNSSVGVWDSNRRYFIKAYPKDVSWDRRGSEERAIEYYLRHGLTTVPSIHHSNPDLNYTAFRYIEGAPPYEVTDILFGQIKVFLDQVCALPVTHDFQGDAKEAFFDTVQLKTHIDQRLAFLRTIDDLMLQQHLRERIDPALRELDYDHFPDCACDSKIIISPSDFGTHNSLLTGDQKLYFIDFEYAGRDSLFKLLGDIYWHPGSNLTLPQRMEIINARLASAEDRAIYRNVRLLMGLKWSLLLLNEFIPLNLQKRIKASGDAGADIQKIKQEQLKKSNDVLKRISDDWRCGI